MKKTIYVCDRCGKEVDQKDLIQVTTSPKDPTESISDLCPECYEDFMKIIKDFMNGKPAAAEKKEEKKGVKKNGGSRHRIQLDLGKVGALRNAGWTIKAIADEMNVSLMTISKHLNEALAFYEAQKETR